jgi:predicted DNA-binding transcriptional regulator YafY
MAKDLRNNRNTIIRIWEIHKQIKNGYYPSVRDLAQNLEVNQRTIERDIEQLRDRMSAPIEYDRIRKGYYYTNDFTLPPFQFTEGEMVCLFLGQKLLTQLEGTAYRSDLQMLFDKLQCLLTADSRFSNSMVEDIISFNISPLRGEDWRVAQNFSLLRKAANLKNQVKIEYHSMNSGETAARVIFPYHLRYHQGAWYVIAYCTVRSEPRIFALDRINSIEVLTEKFNYPADFNIDKYLENVWGIIRGTQYQVVIEFDQFQAKWIKERPLKAGEKIRESEDGGVIFTCEVSGLTEIKQWALSFGSHAKVLSPPELITELEQEIKKLGEIYQPDSGCRSEEV